ncbi:MAG: DUF2017 family protein [Actinobacteria bacterium]|nr:DUF2017 family protein [Actinomycetota bacterium]
MTYPFANVAGGVAVLLAPAEREVLLAVPILLRSRSGDADGAPAWARLRAAGHLDDPEAAARFADLTAGMLAGAQADDLDRFEETLDDEVLDTASAECWMRAIGEARLLVAARLGIEEDGWEDDAGEQDLVEMTVLRVLGYLQEGLVAALSERI